MIERGFYTPNEIVLKTGVPAVLEFTSLDFVHGFKVPDLNLRADLHGTGVGVSTVFPGFIRDAGMFHDSGATLPSYVGTRTPDDVAEAVLRAIERDLAEVDVAPLGLRAGATLGSLAPELSARITRRLGGDQIARAMESGQAAKR